MAIQRGLLCAKRLRPFARHTMKHHSDSNQTFGHRREDGRLTTGGGQYADDIRHEGALRAVFLRSPYPAALIRSIDTKAAMAHPGVIAVLTGAHMAAEGFDSCPQPFKLSQGDGSFAFETPRPLLPPDRVRFVGEPVVMVVAESYEAAVNASELVMIDYEEQESVADVAAAREPGAAQLWDERPNNVAFHWRAGDNTKVEAALASSHHIARLTSKISRVAAMPLEPRAALAYLDDDGRPVLHVSHQSPHQIRDEIASMFKRDPASVRVVAGDVGGSFGMKIGPLREEVLVVWATLHLRRPVRWNATRSESFLSDEQARDVVVEHELGLDASGRFTALRMRYQANVGAYMSARSVAPINNFGSIAGVYTTPVIAGEVVGVFTNTQTTAPYRGAGRPDATYAIERIIDIAAMEMGIDPAELRRRNLIPGTAMPYKTALNLEYDCGDFEPNLDKALELAAYATFAQRREESRQRGRLRGIGISMPIERAGAVGTDWATVRAHPDGMFTLTTGSMSVGQGHETGFSLLVAQRLGVSVANVIYVQGDTDRLENGRGNGGSSALIQGGSAAVRATDALIERGASSQRENLRRRSLTLRFFKVLSGFVEPSA